MAFELTDGARGVTGDQPTVKEQAVEIAVFLFLIVPSMVLSLFAVRQGNLSFILAAVATIFRGYLMLRFQAVLRGPARAVLLSSLIFSLGHGYEGSAGLVTVGVMGAVFALIYLWRLSLVAPVVMHFLQDFLSIVLLPFLGMK